MIAPTDIALEVLDACAPDATPSIVRADPISLQSRVRRLDNARYHGAARDLSAITVIGWHSTRGHDADEAMSWDNRPNSDNPACYNYVLAQDGTIDRVCPIAITPWSNGDSRWPNPTRYPPGNGSTINRHVLAIAVAGDLDTTSGTYRHLTPEQLESAWWLGRLFTQQFPDAQHVGHLETSPGRKDDPRPQFLRMAWWRALLAGDACPTYAEYLDVHPLPALPGVTA